MKRFKIFYCIILLLLSYQGNAFGKAAPIIRKFSADQTYTKQTSVFSKLVIFKQSAKLKYYKPQKSAKLRVPLTKSLKRKATSLDNNLLANFYCTNYVTIRYFGDALIYGITVTYTISRHSYLHLYQLF